METLELFLRGLRETWRGLPLGSIEKQCLLALVLLLFFYAIFYPIQRAYGLRTGEIRSRAFLHDVAYWFYYRTGLNGFLVTAALFAAVDPVLARLDLGLLGSVPFASQVLLYVVVGELFAYWVHRAQHRFRLLWAFHTTHHSQESLNFATAYRFHPVDHVVQSFLVYIPLRILGASPEVWLPLALASEVLGVLNHSRIPWTWGPLGRIFVSPAFHAHHHSIDPAHHHKNYCAGIFSFWDYLFGTAVSGKPAADMRFGLESVKPVSLWSTLWAPFAMLAAQAPGGGPRGAGHEAGEPGMDR